MPAYIAILISAGGIPVQIITDMDSIFS